MPADDLFGQAMSDYHSGLGNTRLMAGTQVVDWEELPVNHFFRTFKEMPVLERYAMEAARGKILDMGAGAGAHTLHLQSKGHPVVAVDSSPGAVKVMKARGVKDARCMPWQDFAEGGFDTVLLLMNGIGLAGRLSGIKAFSQAWKKWLSPNGRVLIESTDIAYIYDFPLGSNPKMLEPYYGEQTYRMRYGQTEISFPWLFADEETLIEILKKEGWQVDVLYRDGQGSFLVDVK